MTCCLFWFPELLIRDQVEIKSIFNWMSLPSVLWQDAGLGLASLGRQSQLCALGRSHAADLSSPWISGTWYTLHSTKLWLSVPIPPLGILLLFVWCSDSGCAEVNVSKWRCLNNKAQSGMVSFSPSACSGSGELYREGGTESEILTRCSCCCSAALSALQGCY